MAEFHLVRHAVHDQVGKALMGRIEGVRLSQDGRAAAEALAAHFADFASRARPVAAVYTSPLERARETAAPIAARLGLAATVLPAIAEIEFGSWSGRPFDDLGRDLGWQAWNSARSLARPPGGETMLEVQARAVDALEALAGSHPEGPVVLVSHGDVIKAALAHYLGVSLDHLLRFELDPGSVSILERDGAWARVACLNRLVA